MSPKFTLKFTDRLSEIYRQQQMNNGSAPPTAPFNTESMLNLTEVFLTFFSLYHILGLRHTVMHSCHLFISYSPFFLILYS